MKKTKSRGKIECILSAQPLQDDNYAFFNNYFCYTRHMLVPNMSVDD